MSDFTLVKFQINSGVSDASPTWSDIQFGTLNHELRLCASGAGGASIASAAWPLFQRPGSVSVIPEMWAYVGADASGGLKVTTYDGTSAHYMQGRISWDALGTFAAAPVWSAWKDNTLPAASPGTQSGTGDGSSFINGSADTSNKSYVYANMYGSGVTAAGVQETPAANAAGTLTPTSGTAGAVSPPAASWLATWQSLQAATSWIQAAVIPKPTTAGLWYTCHACYSGPGMSGGTLVFVVGLSYTWV